MLRHLGRNSRRIGAQVALALVVVLAVSAGSLLTPQKAKAHVLTGPVQVGVSFSQHRAWSLHLDSRESYQQVLAMKFKVVRLGVYWSDVSDGGYAETDWQMQQAAAAGQPVVLTVGMKSLGWPEFYIPPQYAPTVGDGQDVSQDGTLRAGVLDFVRQVVDRYRGYGNLVAWQVENEPFNPAGPRRWYIGKDLLLQESAAVRSLDRRPQIVNVFGHFNMQLDQASSRNHMTLGSLLGFDSGSAERDSLSVLQPGDALGEDVYTRIGYQFLGGNQIATANADWDDHVAQWRGISAAQGKGSWVTEMQAEPWEVDRSTLANPKSFAPADLERMFNDLKAVGTPTVLLWGAEYWLWRAQNGDPTWLEAVRQIQRDEAKAPPIQ
jgi:hypothetical protein